MTVRRKGFRGKDMENDAQQKFTFEEQLALAEGLIRVWYLREFPRIRERYKVLAVEREIEPIKLVDDVYLQAKIDAELQDMATGDFTNYSLKTCKQWDERMEESYKSDLQGITEIWAAEEDSKRSDNAINNIICELQLLKDTQQYPSKNLDTIEQWLSKQGKGCKKVNAIRFCYLVKGKTYNDHYNENSLARTYSPLIRGYRNFTPGGVQYAHSWTYPNPENKSGKGTLGKGWEPFNVWESDIKLKDWIKALDDNLVQPECGDVLQQQVVTPIEYFRDEGEIEEGIREVTNQEWEVFNGITSLSLFSSDSGNYQQTMSTVFRHNRKACHFQFGSKCQYYDLCWKPEVREDPLGSGLYEIRIPHHEKEREQG